MENNRIYSLDEMKELIKQCKFDLYKDFTNDELYKNFKWIQGSFEQHQLISKFRDIFIDNDYSRIHEIFDEDFGIHNGYLLNSYLEVEFDEFKLKCEKFGLTKNAEIFCCQIAKNLLYFSLGKKTDKALFEAIFYYDHNKNKLKGNQYFFKTEPKLQFYLDKNNNYSYTRRINLKSICDDIQVKAIIPKKEGDEFLLSSTNISEILGGFFYHTTFQSPNHGEQTYWDIIKIVTNIGTINYPVLMRGRDHPLFMDNLYPEVHEHQVIFHGDIFPVVLSVFFSDKAEEELFKYPLSNTFNFKNTVTASCLTDTLSYDWMIEKKN